MNKAIDRISSLPDDVLTHILSCVSTREAVQTCVLSKRWRNTWTSVPVLNFDFNEFPIDHSDDVFDIDDNDEYIEEELKFDLFVSSVLENRGPSRLDTVIFRGEFGHHFREPSMGWLDRAALLMPRVIIADIPEFDGLRLNLPDSVFSCASLENLELYHPYGGKADIEQNSIALVSLKTLTLGCLVLEDDFSQKLLLGCPALENLKLYNCELFISDVSSNVLKELTLDGCWLLQHMRICCPVLVSLFINSCMNSIRIISLEKMDSLLNASIDLSGYDEEADIDNLPNPKFLSGLSNATSLNLRFRPFPKLKELWEKDISNCRTFYNLKNLDIGAWNMVTDFSVVACFLKYSPVLEQLTLRLDKRRGVIQEMPRQDISFQLEYLETVNILCVEEDKLDSKLVSLLGQHVKTVGNINIRYTTSYELISIT